MRKDCHVAEEKKAKPSVVSSTSKRDVKEKRPNALKTVLVRNGFFWVQYKSLLAANIIAGCLLLSGIGALTHFVGYEPPHKYIPTTSDFKVIVSPPLAEEFASEGDVVQVATNGLREVYTYDFVNWQDQIGRAKKWFTMEGWNSFEREIKASGAILAVEQKRQVASIKIYEAPFVKEKGLLNGVYTWIVEFPSVEVIYRSGNDKESSLVFNYAFRVEVSRASLEQSPKGVAIAALRAKEIIRKK
jgi:Type-IV b secretion system, inner-membrane complex component